MKKLFSLFSMLIMLSSNVLPAFTYAESWDNELAMQILTNELENLWGLLNNNSWSNQLTPAENPKLNWETSTNNVNMNDQLKSINFTRNEIIIPDPTNANNWIIIMDRNLWATVPWTGEGSYWYFYQWWNNYGFADTWEVEWTTELVTWNDSYSHSWYYWNKFINTNNSFYWSDNNPHSNSWWWEWDEYENYRWYNIINETAENRQWPCPDWWHVPSIWEWSKLVNFWFDYNHKNWYNESPRLYRYSGNYWLSHLEDTASMLIVNDLLIPWAWLRYNSTESKYQNQKYWYWYYYSSTPNIYLYISYNNFCPDQSLSKHTYWYSVRCFKNTYDPDIYTITFNTNWWHDYESKQIAGWTKLMLYTDPIKFWSAFEWWYKDEALTEPFDFNTPVTQSITLYAKWKDGFGTISISDPENPLSWFTIMDRNLWSKKSWTGEDAHWYYYQWWNNHGFSTIMSYTTVAPEWNDDYIHQWYYWTQFVTTSNSNYWSDNQLHNSVWWWENDNGNNKYWFDIANETAENRQWPCPNWYHIPSAWERTKLLEYRKKSFNYDNNVILNFDDDKDKKKSLNFIDYFELPLQDYYEPITDYNGIWTMRLFYSSTKYNYWYYRSSSVPWWYPYALYLYKKWIEPQYSYASNRWHNIRCFANEYIVPENTYKLTLYTNSWSYIDIREIKWNHKLTWLPKFTREHSVLEWWYSDENLTEMNYDFNRIVDGDLTFYAKWSCDYWYQMSNDWQSCEPISVKFNANWWKFLNNENILTKSSYLKEISPEITEIIHTSNVLDDWTQSWAYSANNRVDVVTIPWAKKLHIILNWWFEWSSGEWMRVWSWSHPDYTPESHSDTAIKFEDWNTWLWGPQSKTEDFEIDWDSVSFWVKTDSYTYWWVQYWYHAKVTKEAEYVVEYEDWIFNSIEEPKRPWYDFIWWYYTWTDDEYNPTIINTWSIVEVNAKWKSIEEKMEETPSNNVWYTNDTTVTIDNEVDNETIDSLITISLVTKEVEDNEVSTWEDKVVVQNTEIQVTSDKTVEYQWWLEVYLEKTENETTEKIEWTAKFSAPIAVKIPISSDAEYVKVQVKHQNEAFGYKWLTLNSENECNNWEAVNYKYRWEDVIVTWDNTAKYAIIYTCSASTFVAYTENRKPAEPSPAAWWGRIITSSKQGTKNTEQEHNSADTVEPEETQISNQTSNTPTIQEQVKKIEWRSLTRWEVAIMTNILLEVYPQLVEWKQELDDVTNACSNYADEQNFTKDEKKAITKLCKLSIMWIHNDTNKPLDEFLVNSKSTNDEFSKVINRSIETYNEKDLSTIKDALKKLEWDEENVVFGTVYDVFMSIKNIFN